MQARDNDIDSEPLSRNPRRQDCGGSAARSATATASKREDAEDKALRAARNAADAACKKECPDNGTCIYVEEGTEGSSEPAETGFTATMKTTGKCTCK